MKYEVNVIVVIDVDNNEEAQEAASQIMHAAEGGCPSAIAFGANWTKDPELFDGDYSYVPELGPDHATS